MIRPLSIESLRLVIVGGPNGCGKTTFARAYSEVEGLIYLGADDVAARLSPDDPQAARVTAGRIFGRELSQALAAGSSLVVESTLSGGSFARYIEHARVKGYAVELVFVFLDSPELCVERIAERVAQGGHEVPEVDVRRRYIRSLSRFRTEYRALADDWLLIDNSGGSFVRVASGDENSETVYDEEVWQKFQKNGDAATNS
ncbi:Zeta toxin family protein [bacterium]|nr:MAG: Zeta toxin family protein [bacterium]